LAKQDTLVVMLRKISFLWAIVKIWKLEAGENTNKAD